MICSMAKKAGKRIRKLIKRFGDNTPVPQKGAGNDVSSGCLTEAMIMDLISVDSMLCESASIANTRFKEDSQKLMEIISTHHVGLENLMKKFNLKMRRSLPGTEFDPEYMTAHPMLVDTDDAALHGTVAVSVTPGYYSFDDHGEKMLRNECVMLYRLKENSI